MWGIFLLLGGLVLHANPDWFNGAETVGTVAAIIGGLILAIQLILTFVVGAIIKKEF